MVIGIIIYLVVFILLWMAGTFLTRFCLRKWVNKNNSTGKAFGIFTVIYYLVFMGDYHLSSMVFNHYCSDEELVGFHIYEKVKLPSEMLLPPPKTSQERRKIDATLLIDDGSKLIDRDKFKELYDYKLLVKSNVFPIGPIYKVGFGFIRKADGKLLGKEVIVRNGEGWFADFTTFGGNTGTGCPQYTDKNGQHNNNYDYASLIDAIFDQE